MTDWKTCRKNCQGQEDCWKELVCRFVRARRDQDNDDVQNPRATSAAVISLDDPVDLSKSDYNDCVASQSQLVREITYSRRLRHPILWDWTELCVFRHHKQSDRGFLYAIVTKNEKRPNILSWAAGSTFWMTNSIRPTLMCSTCRKEGWHEHRSWKK